MKRTREHKIFADINVTPLVDVMLVLLVIFMVTTPMLVKSIRVNLPKSSSATSTISKKDVIVSITKNGQYFLDKVPVTLDQLARYFKTHPYKNVIINADKKVNYGAVVHVISIAKAAGIKRVGLSTRLKR